MNGTSHLRRRLLATLAGLLVFPPARAISGELTLVSEPSLKGVMTAAAGAFEKATGMHVTLHFIKPSQLATVLKGMDPPDLVVLPQELIDQAMREGLLVADSRRPFGRTGLVIAVKSGVPPPDVATPEALKRVLEGARSLAYADPAETLGGKQAAQLIAGLGLTEALKSRTTLGTGSNPVAQVGLGAVDIGLLPRHEAVDITGVTVAGPLPAALQPWHTYGVALTENASNVAEARRLMDFLAADSGRRVLEARGVWSPT